MFLEDRAEEIVRMWQNADHTFLLNCSKISLQKQKE